MDIYLQTAISAAREAGQILLRRKHMRHEIRHKADFDFVTEMDELSETTIRGILTEAFPTHRIMGEEEVSSSGRDEAELLAELGDDDYLWVIDALDGTTNYIRGLPQFCVSIAMVHNRQLQIGVVYDPVADEMFSAQRGRGAWLNDAGIRVSEVADPAHAIFGMGFPAAELDKRRDTMAKLSRIDMDFVSMRVYNCAALLLCYVACGRLDMSFEMGIHLWDMAGGALLVQEAGGTITRCDGSPFDLFARDNMASNGRFHAAICDKMRAR